jgi:hypothetical protein
MGLRFLLLALALSACRVGEPPPQPKSIGQPAAAVAPITLKRGAIEYMGSLDLGGTLADYIARTLTARGTPTALGSATSAYRVEGEIVGIQHGPMRFSTILRLSHGEATIFEKFYQQQTKALLDEDDKIRRCAAAIARDFVDDVALAFAGSPVENASRVAGTPPPAPHHRKVFFSEAPLSALPPDSYLVINPAISVDRRFYGRMAWALDDLAQETRAQGADAVFELQKYFRPSAWAWATPRATGKAIVLRDPCALEGINGEIWPKEEVDSSANRPTMSRCTKTMSAPDAAATAPPAEQPGECSTDQILTMKNAGLTDAQVKAACGK